MCIRLFEEQYFYIVRENLVGEVVNFVNHHQWFVNLKPSKLVFAVINLLADLFIRQLFVPKCLSIHLPNFITAKFSCYAIYVSHLLQCNNINSKANKYTVFYKGENWCSHSGQDWPAISLQSN